MPLLKKVEVPVDYGLRGKVRLPYLADHFGWDLYLKLLCFRQLVVVVVDVESFAFLTLGFHSHTMRVADWTHLSPLLLEDERLVYPCLAVRAVCMG